VPNSRAAFTQAQINNVFAPPDWHPEDHPPMPDVVAHGRAPALIACAYCHLPDGKGRPENAALAGLPAAYIAAQVAAIRVGARRSAWSGAFGPIEMMRSAAAAATDAEIAIAAAYFSKLTMTRRVEVVESQRVPKTHVAGWLYVPTPGAGTEPLGQRIIEIATDHERHERRDSASGYRAYVPLGSVERGRVIAVGSGSTPACVICHGADLRGATLAPPIAGRSPTYIVRQLLAYKSGARATAPAQAMQPVVARLNMEDVIAVAAYAAAQTP